MRKTVVVLMIPLLFITDVSAETDVADLMPTIEDVAKSLDTNVALKQAKAAAEAKALEVLFKQVEATFAREQDAADAVAFAQKTQGLALAVAESVEANDFDAATDAYGALMRSCKACHSVYRP